MPIFRHKRTGVEALADLLSKRRTFDSENVTLMEINKEYAFDIKDTLQINEVTMEELKSHYKEKRIILLNRKFIYYLDAITDPDFWYYYRKKTIVDEDFYRRDDSVVSFTWTSLDPSIVSNLVKIDFEKSKGKLGSDIFIHTENNRIYERAMNKFNLLPGVSYKYEEFKSFPNNATMKMEFMDEDGYTNSGYDQFVKKFLEGGINLKLDELDRKFKLMYSPGYGVIPLFPELIQGSVKMPYVIQYRFIFLNEGMDDILAFSSAMPLLRGLESIAENFAVRIEFKTVYGFIAFANKMYFGENINGVNYKDIGANSKQFLDDFMKIVILAFTERIPFPDEMYKMLFFLPNAAIKRLEKVDLWYFVQYSVHYRLTNLGMDKEDIVIKILKILSEIYVDHPKKFLDKLTNLKAAGSTLIERLVYRLDGYNFTAFVDIVRDAWRESIYSSFDEKKNPAFNGDGNSPALLNYTSDKTIGFHHDNAKIEWMNDKKHIFVWIKEVDLEAAKEGEIIFTNNFYGYHPFAPIAIIDELNPNFIFSNDQDSHGMLQVMPAFVLLARESRAFWSNLATAAEYAGDILSFASGYGSILKAGRIYKIFNAGKSVLLNAPKLATLTGVARGTAGVFEITAGVGNGLLKLTGAKDTELGQSISEVLMYMEFAALTGEVSVAISKGINKAAKKAVGLFKNSKIGNNLSKWDNLAPDLKGFLQKLAHGSLSIGNEIINALIKAKAIARVSLETLVKLPLHIAKDIIDLGVDTFLILNHKLLKTLLKKNELDALFPRFATLDNSEINYFAVYGGENIFSGTKKQFSEFADGLGDAVRKGGKSGGGKYLDDVGKRATLADYYAIRQKIKKKFITTSQINAAWKKKITNRKLRTLSTFYKSLIKKHLKLKGKNFAEFKTKVFKNGKLIEEIIEFSNSGKTTLEGFIKRIRNKEFLENVIDTTGRSRRNDSEIKYIYHFLTTHLQKGDYFIIETTNIMTACSSCKQEFLILKELLGDKVKIIVNAREEMEFVRDVEKYIKN